MNRQEQHTVKLARGEKGSQIVVGNIYDKYHTRNPIARVLMARFTRSLIRFVERASPSSILEIGCGEGYWTLYWKKRFGENFISVGNDFSDSVLAIARANAQQDGFSPEIFYRRSIYDLDPQQESADLLICSEVLEHLDKPGYALARLRQCTRGHIILTVPREPMWRVLNMCRGKYWSSFGNTPGHVQHWSAAGFRRLILQYFDILDEAYPVPFIMMLCKKRVERSRENNDGPRK